MTTAADTRHTEQIITEELIKRAWELGACASGLAAAREAIGRPIGVLASSYVDWAARLFDGKSVLEDGTEEWWRDGRRHRADGPAVVHPDGMQEWWRGGRRHRDDGPAVVFADGRQEYWCDGQWCGTPA
jgi:hypothetical protein